MKPALLLLCFLFAFLHPKIFSQTVVTIGTTASTSSSSGPANSTTAGDRNERHTAIYSVAELTTAGLNNGSAIMSIAWEKTGIGFYYSGDIIFRVWLKHSAATSFAAVPVFGTETTGATLVYEINNFSMPSAAGVLTFPFNTATPSFTWNGTQNLQVITELIRPTDWTETGFLWRTTSTVANAAANGSGTIAAPGTLTRTGTRPQVRLGISTPGVDASVTGFNSPVSGPAGIQNITAVLRNTGTATLTAANIAWNIDAGTPGNFAWSGSLAPGAVDAVILGSNNFAGGAHIVEATVTTANGSPDVNPANNTATKNILICAPMSGAYTINKGAPTLGTNFNSFNDFSTYLTNCGVGGHVTATVVDGSGPYIEQVVFQNIPGIGAGASVTIEGNAETMTTAAPIIQTGSNPNRHIIRLIGLQYFTINNLDIDIFPGSTGFIGIHVLNSGNHITLSNNNVDMGAATSTLLGAFVANSDPAGILFPGGTFDNIHIFGNTCTGGGYGAAVNGLASPRASNVVIRNNTFYDFNSNGVYLRETDGAQVHDNEFDKRAGTVSAATGIQLAQAQNINGRIFNNRIRMSQTSGGFVGIYLFNGTGHRVYNNLIYDIRSTTGDIIALRVRQGGTAPELFSNTVTFDNPAPTTGTLIGFSEDLANTNTVLRNNIFNITQGSSDTRAVFEIAAASTTATAITSNTNALWIPGGNIAVKHQTLSNPDLFYATLPEWQAVSGEDLGSWSTDPQFVSPTNPVPTSGVINNLAQPGTFVLTDITGAARGALPDPGAFEFAPPAGDAAFSGYVLPTLPYCANTLDVQFTLTNSGSDPLNTVTINWMVNGVPQTAVNWTGPALASGSSTTVTLGTIPVSPNTRYDFSATTSLPNGFPDVNPANDNFIYIGYRNGLDGTYTINGGSAASATNFQTFQSIANELNKYGVCGPVTIDVSNGPYTEGVIFNTIPGASSVNRVTLNGNNQVLQFAPSHFENAVLKLDAVNYFTVENLTVTSLHATQGRGIHITNGSSRIAIRNNTVNVSTTNSVSESFGIIISGDNWLLDGSLSDSVVITGNTVRGGYSSIQLSGEHWTQPLTRMVVADNTVLDWYGFGVYLSYTNGARVSNNIIRRPTRTNSGSDAVTPAGITVPAGSLDFILEKNRMYDFHAGMPGSATISRGFYISGTGIAPTSGTIRNNLVYGMNNNHSQYGIQQNSVNGPINIYHNTFVLDGGPGTLSNINTHVIQLSNSSAQFNTNIRNNLFYLTRGGTGSFRIIDVSDAATNFTCNNNITWMNSTAANQAFGEVDGSPAYPTLAAWQAGTGKDVNSVFIDPVFTNPATGNFRPTNFLGDGSIMNTLQVGGITDDILNIARGINPDPGAFEFAPVPCNSAAGGTATAAITNFCATGSTTLSATGYTTGFGLSYQWQFSNDNFVSNIQTLVGETNPASGATGVINSTTYYRLRVTCVSGPVVAYSNIVTITVNQPAVITAQPVNQTVCFGTLATTFSVTATGALSYQWQQYDGANWNNIAGATSSSLTVTNATHSNNTNPFRVVVTGQCGPVNSNHAVLWVNPLPTVVLNPSRLPDLLPGQVLDINATAVVAGGTYAWYKNGVLITGASGNSLAGLTVDDAGSYYVIYTDMNGCVKTSATLAVTAMNSGNLYIYPAPNNGSFQVRFFNSDPEAATVSVFDAKGALVYKKQFSTALPYTQMNITLFNAPSGTYLVRVNGAGGRVIGAKWITVYK